MARRIEIKTGGVYTFSRSILNGSLVVEAIRNNQIKATFFNMFNPDLNTEDTKVTRWIGLSWFNSNLPSYVCQIGDLWGRSNISSFKSNLFKNVYQLDTGDRYTDACEMCGTEDRRFTRVKFKGHIVCSECFTKYTTFCKSCGKRIYNSLSSFSTSSEFCNDCLEDMKKKTEQESDNWAVNDVDVVIPPKSVDKPSSEDKKQKRMDQKVYKTESGIPYFIDEETGKKYFYLTVSHHKSEKSKEPKKVARSRIGVYNNDSDDIKYYIVNEVYNDKDPSTKYERAWWSEDLVSIFATISVKAIATKYHISTTEASIIKRNSFMLVTNKEIKPAKGTKFATLFNQGFTLDEVIDMHREDMNAVIVSFKSWSINSNSTPDSNSRARIKWVPPITFMNAYDLATKFILGDRKEFSREEGCSYSIACEIFSNILTNQIYYEPLAISFGPMAFKLSEIESYIGSLKLKDAPTIKDKCDLIVYDKIMKLRAAYIDSFNDHGNYIFRTMQINSMLISEEMYPDLLMLIRNRFGILVNNLTEAEKDFILANSIEDVSAKFIWRYSKVTYMKKSIMRERNKTSEINCSFDCTEAKSLHEALQIIGADGIILIKSALYRIKLNSQKIKWCYNHILAPKNIIDEFYTNIKCFDRMPKEFIEVLLMYNEDQVKDFIGNRHIIEYSLSYMKDIGLDMPYERYLRYMSQLASMYDMLDPMTDQGIPQ